MRVTVRKPAVKLGVLILPEETYKYVLVLQGICIDLLKESTSYGVDTPPLILFTEDSCFRLLKKASENWKADLALCDKDDPTALYSEADNIIFFLISRLEKEMFENYLWFPFLHLLVHEMLHVWEAKAGKPIFNLKESGFEFNCDYPLVFNLIEEILSQLQIEVSYRDFMKALSSREEHLEGFVKAVGDFISALKQRQRMYGDHIKSSYLRAREKYVTLR